MNAAFRHLSHAAGLATLLLPAIVCAATEPLDALQKTTAEWVRIRTETVRLESDWASDKMLLESTVEGLKERAAALETKRDEVKAKTAKEREELDAMRTKNTAAAEGLQRAEIQLKALGEKLLRLRPALPPRLSEALELPFRSLARPELSAGERMQLITTVLNRCVQFNRTITGGEGVLAIDGGKDAKSYEVMYWGLSHGYAIDREGKQAWLGLPGPGGWCWEPLPGEARAVARLIAIYNDKSDPDFVVVPARLTHLTAETSTR